MALNLTKNQTAQILKDDGRMVTDLTVGVSWGKIDTAGAIKTGFGFADKLIGRAKAATGVLKDVDLDLTIITFSGGVKAGECAFYSKNLFNGAITHSGDDRGGDEGDDGLDNERIVFRGMQVATKTNVDTAYIVLNSYSHDKFDDIPHIRLGIYDGSYALSEKASRLMEFDIKNDKSFDGTESMVLAKIVKTNSGWSLTTLAQPLDGKSIAAIADELAKKGL